QRDLRAIDDLVPRRPRRKRDVVSGVQRMLLFSQPQGAFALEDEDRLVVGEMEMERKRLLTRLQLEPAHAQALSACGGAEPLPAKSEAALLHDLIVALHQRGLVHAFFPS